MSGTPPDFSAVVPLLSLNWEADHDAFRYLLETRMGRIVEALEADGVHMPAEDIGALHDAAWVYRARVLST